jgi:hypothetical protein
MVGSQQFYYSDEYTPTGIELHCLPLIAQVSPRGDGVLISATKNVPLSPRICTFYKALTATSRPNTGLLLVCTPAGMCCHKDECSQIQIVALWIINHSVSWMDTSISLEYAALNGRSLENLVLTYQTTWCHKPYPHNMYCNGFPQGITVTSDNSVGCFFLLTPFICTIGPF